MYWSPKHRIYFKTTKSILCLYFFVTPVQIQCPSLYTLLLNCIPPPPPPHPFAYFPTSGYLLQTPVKSNLFQFPFKVRVIGSRLYLWNMFSKWSASWWCRVRSKNLETSERTVTGLKFTFSSCESFSKSGTISPRFQESGTAFELITVLIKIKWLKVIHLKMMYYPDISNLAQVSAINSTFKTCNKKMGSPCLSSHCVLV